MDNTYRCCLLVEDDPEDQEAFIHALHSVSGSAGCYAVSSAEEALLLLQEDDFVPDYIFTDLHMPGIGGLGLLEKLKAASELRHIPVIVYSSECGDDKFLRAKLLGTVAAYRKTHRYDALKKMLEKYFIRVRSEIVDE